MTTILPFPRAVDQLIAAQDKYYKDLRKFQRDPISKFNWYTLQRSYAKLSAAHWELERASQIEGIIPMD